MVSNNNNNNVFIEPARISFSSDLLDDNNFISISPGSSMDKDDIDIDLGLEMLKMTTNNNNPSEFEFLSGKNSVDGGKEDTMSTADELFFEGRLLPYCQINNNAAAEKQQLSKINIVKTSVLPVVEPVSVSGDVEIPTCYEKVSGNGRSGIDKLLGREPKEPRIWFVDDDPSPRPPTCTALWKELLRLRKSRASTLSPSSSSSSTSSSSSSLGDAAAVEEKEKEGTLKKIKKGFERTRSASLRIRPMVNVPICAQTGRTTSLPPLFPIRKKKIER